MNLRRRFSVFLAIASFFTAVSFAQQVWVDRIKSAVNSALGSKGWTLVDSGGSVSIMALEMNQTHQTLNTYYDGFGGGWGWRGWGGEASEMATTTPSTYRVGTLVLDLFDSKTKTLIWRGSGSDTLSDKSDKNINHLDKAVNKLFEHSPQGEKN